MVYSNYFVKKEFKIPTILSLALVFAVSYLLGRLVLTPSKITRAEKKNIKRVETTNILSNQATVIWQTDKKEQGWIIFGADKKNLSGIVLDERDGSWQKGIFLNHYIALKNLKDDTTYYFRIASNDGLANRQGAEPFSFKTTKKTSSAGGSKPAYGKIVKKDGSALENALVLLSIDGSMSLSALSKASGEWLIPLNFIFDSNTKELKVLSGNERAKLEITSEEGESSMIETLVSNLNPLSETIIIGKDYSLLEKKEVLGATLKDKSKDVKLEIIFPKENAIIPDSKPLIKGVAIPNTSLQVSLTDGESRTTKNVKVDKDGKWKLDISSVLSAGKHILEVKTTEVGGNVVTQKRQFTIAKSGEQVLGEATDEPTPVPTSTIAPTPISSFITKTPTPTPPVSGFNLNNLTVVSIFFIVVGLSLFFYGLL